MLNENIENRFGHLRELSTDERLRLIEEIENENEYMKNVINDKDASSEQKAEFYTDMVYNEEKLDYLKNIVEEKRL